MKRIKESKNNTQHKAVKTKPQGEALPISSCSVHVEELHRAQRHSEPIFLLAEPEKNKARMMKAERVKEAKK
jgi:hypothetical protein